MKHLSAALGTILLLGTPAFAAAQGDHSPPAQHERMGGPSQRPGGDGEGRPDRRPFDGSWIGMRLAARLAAAETYVGIRSDQLDAWRAYTSALIALFQPPSLAPNSPMADNALARQEQLARLIKERAARADTLLQAITALRAKLTQEQIGLLERVDLRPHPPMRPGPGGRGAMGHGPMGGGPTGPEGRDGGPGDGTGMMPDDMMPGGMMPGGMMSGGMGPGDMGPGDMGSGDMGSGDMGPGPMAPPAPAQ